MQALPSNIRITPAMESTFSIRGTQTSRGKRETLRLLFFGAVRLIILSGILLMVLMAGA